MTFYLVAIIFGCFSIAAFGHHFGEVYGISITYSILATIILTIAVIAIDGIFAFLIRILPGKWFNSDHKIFNCGKKERKFYEAIGIKFWKDKVAELGNFTNFHKDKVRDGQNPEYLKRFILECNYGSFIHLVGIFAGFLIVFITPLKYFYLFALPVAIVNAILNFLPYAILRYNVPRLHALLRLAYRFKK